MSSNEPLVYHPITKEEMFGFAGAILLMDIYSLPGIGASGTL